MNISIGSPDLRGGKLRGSRRGHQKRRRIIFTPGLMFYIQGSNKIGFNLDVFWLTILEAILIETPAVEDS